MSCPHQTCYGKCPTCTAHDAGLTRHPDPWAPELGPVALLLCPRCKGTWWKEEASVQIPLVASPPLSQPVTMLEEIKAGRPTMWAAYATNYRKFYVCVACNFPRNGPA